MNTCQPADAMIEMEKNGGGGLRQLIKEGKAGSAEEGLHLTPNDPMLTWLINGCSPTIGNGVVAPLPLLCAKMILLSKDFHIDMEKLLGPYGLHVPAPMKGFNRRVLRSPASSRYVVCVGVTDVHAWIYRQCSSGFQPRLSADRVVALIFQCRSWAKCSDPTDGYADERYPRPESQHLKDILRCSVFVSDHKRLVKAHAALVKAYRPAGTKDRRSEAPRDVLQVEPLL